MIAIGCDHGGYELAVKIMKDFDEKKIEYKFFGTFDGKSIDYLDTAYPVATSVASGEAEKGILVCGTGIGMSIAANKVNGVRAAVCTDHFSTKFTRLHNNTNVLCLGGRVTGRELAFLICDTWLSEEFLGGRHQNRIDKISALED